MRYLIFIILILPTYLFSQGGSNYSAIGLGKLNYYTTSAYESLGGTAIAIPDENAINPYNPAMWSYNTSTRLMAGYKFNQHYNQTNDTELFQNNGTISGINAIFSIDTGSSVSAALGIVPYTRVKYYISNSVNVDYDGDTVSGRSFYQGKGGLNRAYIGSAFQLFDFISLGASVHLNFGTIQNLNSTEIYADIGSFNSYVYKNDYMYNFGFKLGAYAEPVKNFGIGAFIENSSDYKLEREKSYFTLAANKGDTIIESRSDYSVPIMYGFGASYKTGKFLLGADIIMQDFSDFEYNRGANSQYSDFMKISAGVNRIGNKNLSADYPDRISYKFGFSYTQQYYTVTDTDINEFAFSIGGAFPFRTSGIIDASLVFGKIGTTDNGLIDEYYGRLSVDISIGETWFKPFRRRY